MADLMHSSLRENNLKRLFYTPHLIMIDTFGKDKLDLEDRKRKVETIVKIAMHFGFDVYVTSLETPENIQLIDKIGQEFEYLLPKESSRLMFSESLNAIKDNTTRQDMIANLIAYILVKTAKKLECQKIFVPDSATTLAVKLMSGMFICNLY